MSSFASGFALNAAQHAVSSAQKDASRQAQAIGKPISSLTGAQPAHSEINWNHFNYPPLIRLIHYDTSELPTLLVWLVRCFNISYLLTVLSCALNILTTLIIAASTDAPMKWILQSLIHALILPSASLAIFYFGYRGVAEPDKSLITRFKVGESVLCIAYFVLAIVPWGCANGVAKLGAVGDYGGGVFWVIVIIIESSLWMLNSLLAGRQGT